MKKSLLLVLATVMAAISLTACGTPFTCDMCGEEKTGKQYISKPFGDDEEIIICEDCYKEIMELRDEFFN